MYVCLLLLGLNNSKKELKCSYITSKFFDEGLLISLNWQQNFFLFFRTCFFEIVIWQIVIIYPICYIRVYIYTSYVEVVKWSLQSIFVYLFFFS